MQSGARKFLGATVSAIIEQFHEGEWQILLQTRWKPDEDTRHSGLLEIPGGRIEVGEEVYDALKREVKEECGLEIQTIKPGRETHSTAKFNEASLAFVPFCAERYVGSNYVGFAFICTAEGELIQKGVYDGKEPIWVKLSELKKMLSSEPKQFYAYHLSTLKFYVEEKEKGNV